MEPSKTVWVGVGHGDAALPLANNAPALDAIDQILRRVLLPSVVARCVATSMRYQAIKPHG